MSILESTPILLVVDDNRDLLNMLEHLIGKSGWKIVSAATVAEARRLVAKERPDAAVLDYMLPDGNGVELAVQLRMAVPTMQLAMITGGNMTDYEYAVCKDYDLPIFAKPFLANDLMAEIKRRVEIVRQKGLLAPAPVTSQPGSERGADTLLLRSAPSILMVDDNLDLLQFLTRLMAESGWELRTAQTVSEALRFAAKHAPDAAMLDYMLPDGNGIELAQQLKVANPTLQPIIMTGALLPPEENAICEEHDFAILRKPFLASDAMGLIRSRLTARYSDSRPEGLTDVPAPSNPERAGGRALRVFFCYSHADEKMRDRLDAHLSMLRRMNIVESWHDRKISPGNDWHETIDKFLASADLVLLLISPDFVNSDYCFKKEMTVALDRHKTGAAKVIPVILRPTDWDGAPFSFLQAVPTNGRPISKFSNRDDGYLDATKSIRRVAEQLSATIHSS